MAAVAIGLIAAASAGASFHLMKIRELRPAGASGSYVELQMWTGGQNAVAGHEITVYNPNGTVSNLYTMIGNVSQGGSQRSVLIAGPDYSGPAADFTAPALNVPAAGGAVCFNDGEPPDCVSWGNFTGNASLPSNAGSPASPSGVTPGMALHRSIAGGCTTLLELGDDTDQSSTDFSEAAPSPTPNSTSPVEGECTFPNTTINSATPSQSKTTSTSITFTFSATPSADATFECKLDADLYESCTSPQEYMELDGDNSVSGTAHTFQVRAKNANGTDQSPASHSWTVDGVQPTATIIGQPADPSPGNSAAFSFDANEAATFQCKLEGPTAAALATCSSGETYTSLDDGEYVFSVKAKDAAGNEGGFDAYEWTVDNSLADTVDPQTTILGKPANPSLSADASFTYASNEPGSSFECKLDAAAFSPCPAAGITYTGLPGGPHTFQVRAADPSANVDDSPAGYSWDIAAPVVLAAPPMIAPPPLSPPATAPETTITAKPGAMTRDRTPTLRFRSNRSGAIYQCKVDAKPFRSCRSPYTARLLAFGRHTIKVRALAGGLADPTPAQVSFTIVRGRR